MVETFSEDFLDALVSINFPSATGPWYWYVPKQQPQDVHLEPGYLTFTFDENGFITGIAATHDPQFYLAPTLAGSERWQWFPPGEEVLEYAGDPLPMIGHDSLEDAVMHGAIDTTAHLGFTPPTGAQPDLADYGLLPLTSPPLQKSLWSNQIPNIWQLTGMPQPGLVNPKSPWNDPKYFLKNVSPNFKVGPNPYMTPSANLAKAVVKTFISMWNATTTVENENIISGPIVPPGWAFKVPWFGTGPANRFSFTAGITEGVGIFPLVELEPGTSTFLAADQLDPKKWDTSVYPPQLKTS